MYKRINRLSDSFLKNVVNLDKEIEALKGVRLLWQKAEKRIERIIAEVCGEKSEMKVIYQ